MEPISFNTASSLAETAQGAFSFIAQERFALTSEIDARRNTVQYHYSSGKLRGREIIAPYNFYGYPGRSPMVGAEVARG